MRDSSGKPGGEKLFAGDCRFILSAPAIANAPPPDFPEVAFIGRSNVGKSSLINALTGRHGLAKASVTPGRTQMLNFFLLAETLMLVDLPGYGYAKAPKSMVDKWNRLIRAYLRHRPNLRRVLVLVDSRRGVMESDHEMMRLLDDAAVTYQLVLTKSDKMTDSAMAHVRAGAHAALAGHPAAYPEIASTSSEKRLGLDELRRELAGLAK